MNRVIELNRCSLSTFPSEQLTAIDNVTVSDGFICIHLATSSAVLDHISCSAHCSIMSQGCALLIGNNNYAVAPLDKSARDAEALGDLLRKQLHFNDVRVLANVDRVRMDKAVTQFVDSAEPGQPMLFYFSGHGKVCALY